MDATGAGSCITRHQPDLVLSTILIDAWWPELISYRAHPSRSDSK